MRVRISKIFRNYVIPLVISIAIFAALMTVVYSESLEFWSRISFTVATIAAIFAGISALIANHSLEVTRNTQRPFLNVIEPVRYQTYEHAIYYIRFSVCNKGIFPADAVSVRCDVFKNEGNVKRLSLELENKVPSIYFPEEKSELDFRDNSDAKQKSGELHVLITISYKNKLSNTKHKTVRSYLMEFPSLIPENYLKVHSELDDWD
ncbi:MAG: hypothetical protein HYU85_08750 [Chloroflexi bacterium]|nr:hypothetical protein [Chloroflexota bacterium]MBI3931493.1 hypothetical protein [Chloroflexota bacterium]